MIYQMKRVHKPGLFGVALLFVMLAAKPVWSLEIKVLEDVTISRDRVILKDVAHFYPPEDARIASVGEIELASAPSPGKSFRLNARFLIRRISAAISDPAHVSLKVPNVLMVHRRAQFLRKSDMERLFKAYIINNASRPWDRITIERIHVPEEVVLPVGQLRTKIVPKGKPPFIGNVYFLLQCHVDGRLVRKIALSGKVSAIVRSVQSTRRVNRGEIIGRRDLIEIEEKRNSPIQDGLQRLDEAVGRRASRTIPKGQALTSRMLENPPMVIKGNRVVIKAENKMIEVKALGRVLEDGWSGDQVRVVNLNSGKELSSIVKGSGLVEVIF